MGRVGAESYSVTVTLLQRRLLNREMGCGKKGRAGIFFMPGCIELDICTFFFVFIVVKYT